MMRFDRKLKLVRRFLAAEDGGAQAQLLLLAACSLTVAWGAAFIVKALISPQVNTAAKALIGLRAKLH